MGWNSTAEWNQTGQVSGWNQTSAWNTAWQGGGTVPALIITGVSSPRGADIASADETLTITLNDTGGVSAVTVNGVVCSNVTVVDATTVTALCPHGFGAPYGASGDVAVSTATASSTGYPVTLQPRSGTTQTAFTVDYAGLNADSLFAGDSAFSALATGDSCIYDSVTTPDGILVTMSGDGVFSLASVPQQDQSFQYSVFDASDNTDGPLGTVTVLWDSSIVADYTVIFGVQADAYGQQSLTLSAKVGGKVNIHAQFPSGSTVTIAIYSAETGAQITLPNSNMVEVASTGQYVWDTSQLSDPNTATEYIWTATDGSTTQSGWFAAGTLTTAPTPSGGLLTRNFWLAMR